MTKETMIRNYRRISAADAYILGFADKGQLYMAESTSVPPRYISFEQASRGQGYSLRLRLKKAWKTQLLKKAICLGSAEGLTADTKYNKGENFERIVSNYYGIEWHKDNEAFTKCGDISVNGVEIQIKFDGATFTTESTLKKQMRLA